MAKTLNDLKKIAQKIYDIEISDLGDDAKATMMNQYISALSLKELLTVNCEVEKIFQKN
jgi:hypothetical protein